MGILNQLGVPVLQNGLKSKSLKNKLLLGLIPPVVVILIITGYITYRASTYFIRAGLDWATQLQAAALAHEMERLLATCREDLSIFAQEKIDPVNLRGLLANIIHIRGLEYRELAYISQLHDDHVLLLAKGGMIMQVPPDAMDQISPSPFTLLEDLKGLGKDDVWISNPVRVEHPFPTQSNPNEKSISTVIYFGMSYLSEKGEQTGYLVLSLDVSSLRNALSLCKSDLPTLGLASPREPETRYSYVFDREGWILFESIDPSKLEADLSTDVARSGFTGILGTPQVACAFRPDVTFENYWRMVEEVKQGGQGSIKTANLESQLPGVKDHFLAYAPIRFTQRIGSNPNTYGGVAYVDRSTLTQAASFRQIDIMFIITLSTVLVISSMIFLLGHVITKPILELTRKVEAMLQAGRLEPIDLPYRGYEISLLKNSINSMVARMRDQMQKIKARDREREMAGLKEQVSLEEPLSLAVSGPLVEIPGLLGTGTEIDTLRSEILRAAQADADVLILGETGTGKQLAAEAVHRLSRRSTRPFMSINCGELNENLLLDTLFGHTKGAFTEAKGDRKGAFFEANGGVLFLDEIQTASPAVQQALLRATAERKIRPLGRDKDIEVDVRLITATNADLKELVDQGKFRKDLYFRLNVIAIHTPSLREHKENIPILVRHYFKQAKLVAKKEGLGLSKGAMEKMKRYSWPGNVRELINCITRAVVMSEGPVIQAGDIKLEVEEKEGFPPKHLLSTPEAVSIKGSDAVSEFTRTPRKVPEISMNWRQEKAYPHILQKGSVTRSEYQRVVGGNLPSRTAIYDLQDLVRKGLLKKSGQGPATRYVLGRLPLGDVSGDDD